MGRGIDNRGLHYITIVFNRWSDVDHVYDRFQRAIGFEFEGNPSMVRFRDQLRQAMSEAERTSSAKNIEVTFTLRAGQKWRTAREDPARYILVQSRSQRALQEKYAEEDARQAQLKKQRTADYDARMEEQRKDDLAKMIIRDGSGKEIFNLYEIQRRGSDSATQLEASMAVYERSGFQEKYLKVVVMDYFRVLSAQLYDLKDFNAFLMCKSATRLGKFVTWTGDITRPALTNVLDSYEASLLAALRGFQGGGAPDKALEDMARVEDNCKYAANKLQKFYEQSVSQAQRIALGLQILQMAIPVGASASFIKALCLEAAGKFSYAVTNKLVNGSEASWASTIKDVAAGSVRDTIFKMAISKLVGKIPKIAAIEGVKGELVRLAVNTVTSEIAQSMGSFFEGKTFGDALANLYRKLKDPETWVTALVNHAAQKHFGRYLDLPNPTGEGSARSVAADPSKGVALPEKTGRSPTKRPPRAVEVILMFGFATQLQPSAQAHTDKPVATNVQAGEHAGQERPARVAERKDFLDRGVGNKGIDPKSRVGAPGQKILQPPNSQGLASTDVETRAHGASEATEASAGKSSRPPPKPKTPDRTALLPPAKRRRKEPIVLKAMDGAPEGVELLEAYRRVGFKRYEEWSAEKMPVWLKYQTGKTRKNFGYSLEFIDSEGLKVTIRPDDLIPSQAAGKLDIVEYKHYRNNDSVKEFKAEMKRSKNVQTRKVYKILEENAHYRHMGDKLFQMMRYVESLEKFPESIGRVIYRCSDPATQLAYQSALDNLHGVYHDRPEMLKHLDNVHITLDPW